MFIKVLTIFVSALVVLFGSWRTLTSASDHLSVGVTGFEKFTTTQTDLDLALKDAAASAKDSLVFQLGGDTYVYHDAGTVGQIDAADTVVKLTGTVDLDALVLSLNTAV